MQNPYHGDDAPTTFLWQAKMDASLPRYCKATNIPAGRLDPPEFTRPDLVPPATARRIRLLRVSLWNFAASHPVPAGSRFSMQIYPGRQAPRRLELVETGELNEGHFTPQSSAPPKAPIEWGSHSESQGRRSEARTKLVSTGKENGELDATTNS